MKKFIYLFFLCAIVVKSNAQTGIPVPQMIAADNLVKSFMNNYAIPGLTIALAKDGKIVYMRGFGFQDIAKTIPVQPNSLFRIASCSKQITSIAIMKLMQEGKLSMSSKVFGPAGILKNAPIISTATITDTRIYNITVQQLLEHTGGWDRDINCNPSPTPPYPYYFAGCDPINNPLSVSLELGTSNPVSENYLVKYLLQKGLNFDPGSRYAYSNIGYLALGAIIEELSGKTYENYLKSEVFAPLGIFDMHTGNNLLSEKQEREVEYTPDGYTNLSVYGTGESLPWTYGGMNVHAMSAHGGWITTARDFVKMVSAVDGFSSKPDILSPATINVMTTPSSVEPGYAKGWQVNTFNNWWHTGAIPGTASEVVRTGSGYIWFIITNKRGSGNFFTALDNLGWSIVSNTTTWPTWDLMLAPTQNASGINFSNITSSSVTVNWTKGNGEKRLLVVKEEASVNSFPLDGTDYTANANFSTAPVLGAGVKVVYNGTGNSVKVTGLVTGKKYYFRIVEYNNNAETGNNSLYLLGQNPEAMQIAGSLPVKLVSFNGQYSYNQVMLDWTTSQESNSYQFIIERSNDGINFAAIGNVAAVGNSSVRTSYHYSDLLTDNAMSRLFYRLKMTDKDGSFEYSSMVAITIRSNSQIFTISPNPAKNVLKIKGNHIASVKVLDMFGRTLFKKSLPANYETLLNISQLAAGNYLIRITDTKGVDQVEKLIIQK